MTLFFIFLTLLVLLSLNVRIYLGVFAAVLVYFFITVQSNPYLPWNTAIQQVISPAANVNFLAIPFFMLLGSLMTHTGIARRMLILAEMLVGKMRGGLAQANILLSAMMGGVSASNLADSAMLTKMLVPEMERQGYNRAFAGGVTAASSLITPIIPPGIALIIYGLVADVSIRDMFMAGILPGILAMLLLMGAVSFVAKREGYVPTRTMFPSGKELSVATIKAFPVLLLIFAIIGGIRFNWFTPSEAGAFAVLFVWVVGSFVYREMRFSDVLNALSETVRATASVMIIIMTCSALSWVLKNERVAQQVTEFILGISSNKWVFLAVVNVVLLLLGTVMEGIALMLIIVPLVRPVLGEMGIDPVHFGIILILNLSIGTLTPPVGTVMLLVCRLGKIKLVDFMKQSWAFYVALLVALLLVTYIPAVSLFLSSVRG